MKDIGTKKYQSKTDLAMTFTHVEQWLNGENSWLTFIVVISLLVILLIPLIIYILYKFFGFKFQFQKVNSILARLLVIGKSPEMIEPVTASDTVTDMGATEYGFTPYQIDFKLLQIVLFVILSIATAYLIWKLTLFLYDFCNTNFLNINSTRLTYLKTLTLNKTKLYLQPFNVINSEYLGIFRYNF